MTMLRKFLVVAAFASLAFVIFATLSPISDRPQTGHLYLERIGAFGLVGLLFGLAFPRRIATVSIIVLGSVVVLELLQLVTPDRHGQIPDALEKLAGGIAGIAAAKLLTLLVARTSATDAPR